MDTSKMLRLAELRSENIFNLLGQSEHLREIAADFFATMDMALTRSQIVDVIEKNYDLGRVVEVYEIFGGYTNRSFGIYTEKDGLRSEYFVRKYKKEITEKEIEFEHSLIYFSRKNGLTIAAYPIETKDGRTYAKLSEGFGADNIDRYFAVYNFLPGEDKYSWIDNNLESEEYASSAETLAIFHNSVREFDPHGLERVELKIMDLLSTLPALFHEYTKLECKNRFHEYYLKNYENIIRVIKKSQLPSEVVKDMVIVPNHCDFHPGNLKYHDGRVVGVYDFDWSKVDVRIFDVSLSIVYFCSSWVDNLDGTLSLDACRIFLTAYQKKLQELGGLSPLTQIEKDYFPEMLGAANLYVLYWTLRSYYSDLSLNVFEYFVYLQHQIRLMYWIEEHRQEILNVTIGL